MDETIGLDVSLSDSDFNLCVLRILVQPSWLRTTIYIKLYIIYMSSLYEIINDSGPTIGREGKLQRFLRPLKKKGFFSKEQYENIYHSA